MEDNEQSEVKSVSLQKVKANRRKRSSPLEPEGKTKVRFNAVKHGFLSKQIVISSKAIGEDPKEFEALLENLQQGYEPGDVGE